MKGAAGETPSGRRRLATSGAAMGRDRQDLGLQVAPMELIKKPGNDRAWVKTGIHYFTLPHLREQKSAGKKKARQL